MLVIGDWFMIPALKGGNNKKKQTRMGVSLSLERGTPCWLDLKGQIRGTHGFISWCIMDFATIHSRGPPHPKRSILPRGHFGYHFFERLKPMVPLWGRCTAHFRTYFGGNWDVHWGITGVLTHGHMDKQGPTLTLKAAMLAYVSSMKSESEPSPFGSFFVFRLKRLFRRFARPGGRCSGRCSS